MQTQHAFTLLPVCTVEESVSLALYFSGDEEHA